MKNKFKKRFDDLNLGNIYFAADEPENLASRVLDKATSWYNSDLRNGYLDKIKRSWSAYHGAYYDNGHDISFSGEQGEVVNFAINHYRNIARIMLNMVTANRPSFQARAANTDYKSRTQTELGNGLLEYYMREKRLEKVLKKAVEYAIVLTVGYIKMEWNATSGEIYDYVQSEEGGESYPIYEGDVKFTNLSPFDVVFDSTKETYEDSDWVLVRTFKNKFDLIAKYPEFAQDIVNLRTKSDDYKYRVSLTPYDETEDVPVYEFFHRSTESIPDGRYVLFVDADTILIDSTMPYRGLPLYRIAQSDILGTPFGYSDMLDLLPIQDNLNSLHSTITTNQNAFGVQNILNPTGNNVKVNQVQGGLNFIEYDHLVGPPQSLNLTQTPAEIFNYAQELVRSMEVISGMNSVARGNPESSLKSGNALALVQSQALQFISNLQQNYIQLIEDIGTGLLKLLQDFASVPRIAAIAGINNKTKMQEFTGDDLSELNRVIVDVGNALSQTTAGRVQMAEQLLQMKLIDSPEKYLEVMNTGKLSSMTEYQNDELGLIKSENESLMSGETEVIAVATDKHSLHIREHRGVLADPKLRTMDPERIQRTLNHINEHMQLLRTTDPALLAAIGEQPVGPAPGSPPATSTMDPNNPSASSMEGELVENMQNEQAAGVGSGVMEPTPPGQNPNQLLPQPAEAPETAPDGSPIRPEDMPIG